MYVNKLRNYNNAWILPQASLGVEKRRSIGDRPMLLAKGIGPGQRPETVALLADLRLV